MADAATCDYSHCFAATPSLFTAPHVVKSLPDLSAITPSQCSVRGKKRNPRRARYYKRRKCSWRTRKTHTDEATRKRRNANRKLLQKLNKSKEINQKLKIKNATLHSRLRQAISEKQYILGRDAVKNEDREFKDTKEVAEVEEDAEMLKHSSNQAKLQYVNEQNRILEVQNGKLSVALQEVKEETHQVISNENVESSDNGEAEADSDYEPGK